ncbi:MAG: neuromedin U, partial [Tepidisphaeraceae bacterium]
MVLTTVVLSLGAALWSHAVEIGSGIRPLSIDPTTVDPPNAPHTSATAPNEKSAEELAKMTQNPVANLISVPFQNNFNFGIGPKDATQWILNIQPVIPVTLNEEWNLITRTIMPIIYQESPADGVDSVFGLGDINPTFFFSPAKAKRFIWGIGPTVTVPTGTDSQLTSGKWSIGPAAVGLFMEGPWVVGALINQQWSFAGWGDKNVSAMLIQPFVNYNLSDGWYLTSSPILTANWEADSDDVWTVPLGAGAGKIVKFGKLPVNISLQAYYNV